MSKCSRFIKKLVKAIHKGGLVPPFESDINVALHGEFGKFKQRPSEAEALQFCIKTFDLTLTAPKYAFLAFHEAGHALVGMKAGLLFKGVRFHDGGDSGVTVFQDPEWKHSTNARFLRTLIAVDVAGNVAERFAKVLRPDAHQPIELLSAWYDGRLAANPPRPPDLFWADRRAHQLDSVVNGGPIKAYDDPAAWPAKRGFLEAAERAVEKLLSNNSKSFQLLSEELMKGPMREKAIRKLIGEIR